MGCAWPGGYPLYFVCGDGAALCFECAKQERRAMLEALDDVQRGHPANDQWLPVAVEVNWEDTTLQCSHAGERIESAYGED